MTATTHSRLARFTTFRIGGKPLRYVMPAEYGELAGALETCGRFGVPWRVLGGGSNLLVEDGELPFAVIHLCSPAFDWIGAADTRTVRTGAGVRLHSLLCHCRRIGLSGLEFLVGIPGTVGGAVACNAGAWGASIWDRVCRAWLVSEDGERFPVRAQDVNFAYRSVDLDGCIVAEVEFALEPCAPQAVARKMRQLMAQRTLRHPIRARSAGCVFKNPPHGSAGKLLDQCGMKGRTVGGAQVSPLHANFIVNRRGASSVDVLALIEMMHEAVKEKFGVELELEVRHWRAADKVA